MITSGTAVGNVRVANEISIMEIGNTELRGIRCTDDLYDVLEVGRQARVYIFRHFFYKPVLLGVKYDTGQKYMVTFQVVAGTALQYALVWPLMVLMFAFMLGILFAPLGAIWAIGGLLLVWTNAVLVLVDYFKMKAD